MKSSSPYFRIQTAKLAHHSAHNTLDNKVIYSMSSTIQPLINRDLAPVV